MSIGYTYSSSRTDIVTGTYPGGSVLGVTDLGLVSMPPLSPPKPTKQRCVYCSRLNRVDDEECDGCGAPL